MSKTIRSARGSHVDFELLAIKSQLAAKPVPKQVEERRAAIVEREGGTPEVPPAVSELLSIAAEAAAVSAKTAPRRK
jgi:hypothetical protein